MAPGLVPLHASWEQPDGRQRARRERARNPERDLQRDGRIYKDQFGRGPTKTRTQWAGPDVLVVTLEQTFTPAERKLCEMGEHARLRELRLLFQYAGTSIFCEPVERLTGRTVRAFVSGIDTHSDLASEMFVLHPPATTARRAVPSTTQ